MAGETLQEISKITVPTSTGNQTYALKDATARELIAGGITFVVSWDGASTPVVANIPAGVVVTYQGTSYTGTMAASSATAGAFYLVKSSTAPNAYDEYVAATVGNTKVWERLGGKDIDLSSYATITYVDTQDGLHVLKAGDTMTGTLANSYAGDAIKVTGANGKVVVSGSGGNVTVKSSSNDNDKSVVDKDGLTVFNDNTTAKTSVAGNKVQSYTSAAAYTDMTPAGIEVHGCSTATLHNTAVKSSGLTVVGSTTTSTSSVSAGSILTADASNSASLAPGSLSLCGLGTGYGVYGGNSMQLSDTGEGTSGSPAREITLSAASGELTSEVTPSGGCAVITKYSFNGDFDSNNDAVVRKADLVSWDASSTKYVKKDGDSMTGALTNSYAGEAIKVIGTNGKVVVSGSGGNVTVGSGADTTVVTADNVTLTATTGNSIALKDDGTIVKTTTASGTTTTQTYNFKGTFSTDDDVVRKSNLGALATKDSATVPAYPTSGTITSGCGTATVHKWKLGTTDTDKEVAFSVATGSAYQHQPEGVVDLPSVKIPSSATTVTALATTAAKQVLTSVKTAGTLPTCTLPTCVLPTTTLPTLAFSVGTGDNAETLAITWTAGSHTSGSWTDGQFNAGAMPTFNSGDSVTKTSTVTAVKGGSEITATVTGTVAADGSSGTDKLGFTGKKYLVKAKYPGALTTDGEENAAVSIASGSVTLTAGSGTQNVTFS